MITKAPRDMTAQEFVAFASERYEKTIGRAVQNHVMTATYFFDLLKEYANLPAPNPFTEDQLAWMRIEQETGMNYAWFDRNGYVFCCEKKPEPDGDGDLNSHSECHSAHRQNFLKDYIEVNNFIRFADYAPLTKGETK